MWQILKYELAYQKFPLIILALSFIAYTVFTLLDFQLTRAPEFEIDYWGGLFSLIIYGYLFIVWGIRIKENRIRLHSQLPLSENQNSYIRFISASFIFIIIMIHLVLIHLVIIDNWHAESGSMIGQIGIALIVFAGFIKGRDDWFSHWNLSKRYRAAFVTVFIIQIIVVLIFTSKPGINEGLINRFGHDAFHYASLIFPLLGFVILVTSIFSFKMRKEYLS